MGYYSTFHGWISITPPASADVVDRFGDFYYGIRVSGDGRSVEAYCDECKAYGLKERLKEIVASLPGSDFTGAIEVFGEDNGDIWRVFVEDRKVIQEEAVITWPSGCK